jgi:nicotinamidase/pyrazinamidase
MTHNSYPLTVGVDIQNDFCPGGNLAVKDGDMVVEPFNVVAQATRDAGGTVVFTRDWHPAVTNHFEAWPVHCVADTVGAAFHPNLNVLPGDIVVSKGTLQDEDAYSGFDALSPTGVSIETIVEEKLKTYEKVVMRIGGLATDYCVKATILDALALQERVGKHRLAVIALENCMMPVNVDEHDGEQAIEMMKAHGALFMNSAEVQL